MGKSDTDWSRKSCMTHWHIDMSIPISIKPVPCRKNKHINKHLMLKLTFPPAWTSVPVLSGQHANGRKQLAKSPTQHSPAHLSWLQQRHDHRQSGHHSGVRSPSSCTSSNPCSFYSSFTRKKNVWLWLFIIFNCRKREGKGWLTGGGWASSGIILPGQLHKQARAKLSRVRLWKKSRWKTNSDQ